MLRYCIYHKSREKGGRKTLENFVVVLLFSPLCHYVWSQTLIAVSFFNKFLFHKKPGFCTNFKIFSSFHKLKRPQVLLCSLYTVNNEIVKLRAVTKKLIFSLDGVHVKLYKKNLILFAFFF